MHTDAAAKQILLWLWISLHAVGRSAALLVDSASGVAVPDEAIDRLRRGSHQPHVYLVCSGAPLEQPRPLYVGKSDYPALRWANGHLPGLRRALLGRGGPYARWIESFRSARRPIHLMVVPQDAIIAPPIPGFPTSVGSVEYQLVALAQDAFPGTLLNREGVGR